MLSSANEDPLLSQPDDSPTAAAVHVLDILPRQNDDATRYTVTPNSNKRRRRSESGDEDEEDQEVLGSMSQMQQPSGDEASSVNTRDTRGTLETNDIEAAIPVKEFLEGLGKEKSRVVLSLHWFITTAINGGINLYVETDNLKTKNLEMKKAMEAVNKGRLADDTYCKYSSERSLDTPLLQNVVESMVNNKMKPIKASIQSIEACSTNNKKMKNVQPQASRKTSKRDSRKSLKEQRGAQPISSGAALQKKKKSIRNSATPTPPPKSIMRSTVNKAVINQDRRVGGSDGDTRTVKFAIARSNSKKKSGRRKKSTKTKQSNTPKASTKT